MKYVLALIAAVAMPLAAQAVTIDLVTVGNPNNDGKHVGPALFGSVATTYRIGVKEVTNAQYAEFLNAKAKTDTLGLYNTFMGMGTLSSQGGIDRNGSAGNYSYAVKAPAVGLGPGGTDYTYGDKPVNFVSFYDVLRFANWMNNGQGLLADTETGAYTLTGGTATPSNASAITRNVNATWFLPNEDEWYKAAYYNATTTSYFDYPTSSDSAPNHNLPSADTGNSANFLTTTITTNDPDHPLITAGAYTLSDSPYGTFDQGGNVAEWNETLVSAGMRGRRGGAWSTDISYLGSTKRDSKSAGSETADTGFRLAAPAAGLAGDYNGNGAVDAADYVVWRKHLNESYQLTNEVAGTTPGSVTQDDYTAWRARFGNTSVSGFASSLSTTSVPEPATGLLVVFAAMIAMGTRRR